VGGHCIGVDPYYLAQKAQEVGYHPEIILAGRRLNDSMGEYVATQVIKTMIKNDIKVNGAKILVLGITFKENCPDVRNTKVVDVIRALESYNTQVTVYDPWANPAEVMNEYNIICHSELVSESLLSGSYSLPIIHHPSSTKFDAIVLGVAHKEFQNLDLDSLRKENTIVYDVKGILTNCENRL
jgi:UDP-N-acetyl-D-galactosamine dehydrogenase